MYRRGRYRRSRRRREELKEYLQKILIGVSIVCIIIVCAAVAFGTRKATQTVEARATFMQAAAVPMKTDVIQVAAASGKSDAVQAAAVTGKKDEIQAAKTGNGALSAKTEAVENEEAETRERPVIIIDPGHGGIDGGCVFDDIVEKDINRMIAVQVVARLRKMGYEAELARQGDEYIDKMERVENANAKNALVYVSIHQNSCEDRSVEGIETWYDGNDTTRDSGRLAELIQRETIRATGAKSRELVSESELCVTSKSTMPSCLIETGFLSNRGEREKLASKEYRAQLADGIVSGISLYLDSKSGNQT